MSRDRVKRGIYPGGWVYTIQVYYPRRELKYGLLTGVYAYLTLYQPMTENAVMVSHKECIYMGVLILLQYMVSASLCYFLWSVKS